MTYGKLELLSRNDQLRIRAGNQPKLGDELTPPVQTSPIPTVPDPMVKDSSIT